MLGSGGGVAGVLHKVPWRAGEDGHCESGRSAWSERDVAASSRGSLPSGRGGTEQMRTTCKGVKTPQGMCFSCFPGVCCSKAALPGPFPERTSAVRCRLWARRGQMWGMGSQPLRSQRLPSPPEPFHTALVRLVCSQRVVFPLSLAPWRARGKCWLGSL